MSCPRKYFYEYVLGWQREEPNVHLEFGTAAHLALEMLLTRGYHPNVVEDAFKAFLSHYRRFFNEEMDEGNKPKNPSCFLRALIMYADLYKSDLSTFKVLHTEVSGSVPISANRLIYFKSDSICEGDEGHFCLEHKTGQRYSIAWAAQWRQKVQVGTYIHVLYSLFPPSQVYGAKINGIFPHEEPKLKKDGTPYAGALDCEFHRVIVRRNQDSMQSWLSEINIWFDLIEDDFERLSEATDEDQVLSAFPRNTESCSQYGLCPFFDWCSVWQNPLRHADSPPVGFLPKSWDPRSPEYVKEVMKL
jgi:hypothetical protein